MKVWLYIALLLISPEIFAGIFDPPPTDKSVSLLGIIFGSNIGNLYLGGSANPVMSAIMEKFNFFIVVAGTIVVSYVGIMSTINTAQEGSAMGKKWSAVWIPMRSIVGMSLMIPSPASGYSMIQVTVMWIILQGIGAADQLWNIALDGLLNGVSAASGSSLPIPYQITQDGQELAKHILNAAICMEEFYRASTSQEHQDIPNDYVNEKGSYVKNFTINDDPQPVSDSFSATVSGYSAFGVDDDSDPVHQDVCGKIKVVASVNVNEFKDENNKPDASQLLKYAENNYNVKMLAISTMLTVLKPLAQSIVDQDQDDDLFYSFKPDSTGYFSSAVSAYASIMSSMVVGGGMSDGSDPDALLGSGDISGDKAKIKEAVTRGEVNGWISAGSFYFIFNRTFIPSLFADATNPPVEDEQSKIPACDPNTCQVNVITGDDGFTDPSVLRSKGLTTDDINLLAKHLATGNIYIERNPKAADNTSLDLPTANASDTGIFAEITKALNSLGEIVMNQLTNVMKSAGDGDPLLSHSIFGHYVMMACEALWLSILLAPAILLLSSGLANMIPFVGAGLSQVLNTTASLVFGLIGIVSPILGLMWAFGASLAIYAPLIPYMIFTMAAIGWLLTVIEAVIAAPLIALGLVTPSGDELGKLENALMLLANIFLRPMLMIFGFLLASRLYKAAVTLIDFGMLDVLKTINVATIFSSLVIMAVYVTFIISVTNTCFSLIYAIPDKVLRWMGGPHEQTDTSAVQQVKASSESNAKMVGGGAGGIADAGGQGASGMLNKGIGGRLGKINDSLKGKDKK